MKKKVLIVTSPLRVGGFDVVATSLQMHLDRERFECTYYIVGEEVGPLEPMVINSGAKVIHRPDSVKGYLANYKYLKNPRGQIRRRSFAPYVFQRACDARRSQRGRACPCAARAYDRPVH